VVDDAQWVDRESLDLLSFVARRLDADRVVMLFAIRDDGRVRLPEGLPALRITGLAPESAHELLTAASNGPIADDVAARVIAETAGSPLALIELTRELTDAQLAGRDVLPATLPVGERLRHHFEAQVKALRHDAQLILLLAAADASGDASLVHRAARAAGIPVAAESALERSSLVRIDRTVEFRHPLIRAAAYASATADERRRAHEALAESIDAAAHPEWRAWHHAAATAVPDEGVAAALAERADVARSRGGYAAEAAFRARAAELTPDAPRRGQRLLEAAQAHVTAGAVEAASRLLDEAAPLLTAPADRAELLRLRAAPHALDTPARVAAPLLTAARMLEPIDSHAARNVFAEAIAAILVSYQLTSDTTPVEVAQAALATPHPAGDDDVVGKLLDGFATRIAVGYGDALPMLRDASAELAAAPDRLDGLSRWALLLNYLPTELWEERATYAQLKRAEQLDRDNGALETLRIRLEGLGHHEMWRGNFAEAERCHAECVDISVALGGNPMAWALNSIELHAWRGDESTARGMATLLLSKDIEVAGPGVMVNVARMGLIVLDIAQGRYQDAFDVASYLFDIDPVSQGNQVLPEAVEAGVRAGELDAARTALARLRERATVAGTPWALGVLARCDALLADDAHAEEHFAAAIEQLSRTELVTEIARTHLVFGEWLRRQRRPTDARVQLRRAHELFGAMGARAFEERARAELAATGERARRRSVDTSNDLTPQEAQIARLASTGATNAEIAAKLFLSAATVDYHLRKVFRKLGVTSRRQLDRDLVP
jgi:DNA-binding CsgD family transcriptional regulator